MNTLQKKKKILLVGHSKKFINPFLKIFNTDDYVVIGWRSINLDEIYQSIDIIIVIGFNHNLYHKKLKDFEEQNIFLPYKFIKNNLSHQTEIIYINTADSKNIYTFSRYRYAKRTLFELLYDLSNKCIEIKVPLVTNKYNIPMLYASILETILMIIYVKLFKCETLKVTDIEEYLREKLNSKTTDTIQFRIQKRSLEIPRLRIIDRLLRAFYG